MHIPISQTGDFFSPKQMMKQAEHYAQAKIGKPISSMLALAVMAGVFIGLAFIFYITVTTGSQSGWGITRLIGGLSFSLGLILVVLCGAELFTSSMLTSIAWANHQLKTTTMLSIWGKVYVGNLIGALGLVVIVVLAGLHQLDHGQWGLNALNIAQHKLHHTPVQAFSLGVLCNLLVCLAIWMTFSAANAMTKAMMTILPVAMFVSTGFEHCIANMFMVPLGIAIHNFAPESFWMDLGIQAQNYADLNIANFITANLIPVTLGNIVGGALLVGLANWAIYGRSNSTTTLVPPAIKETSSLTTNKEITMNANVTIKSIMNSAAICLTPDQTTISAIDVLINNKLSSAPVCNSQQELVGMFSIHDTLIDLWCLNYIPAQRQTVAELMTRDVVTIDAEAHLVDLVEFLCIDKEQLYPTTSMGIATHLSALSLEERARKMKVNKPRVLPVLQQGKFVGVIDQLNIMTALRPIYGPLPINQSEHHKDEALSA